MSHRKLSIALVASFLVLLAAPLQAQRAELDSLPERVAKDFSRKRKTAIVFLFSGPGSQKTELGRFLADEFAASLAKTRHGINVVERAKLDPLIEKHEIPPEFVGQLGVACWLAEQAGAKVLAQGEQGAMAIVTEAVLAGGATAYTLKAPVEAASKTIGGASGSAPPGTMHAGGPEVSPSITSGVVPLSRGAARPTAAEQAAVNAIGNRTGCATCGAANPTTASGNWVLNHVPAKAQGEPRVGVPQCLTCSRIEGGQIRQTLVRERRP